MSKKKKMNRSITDTELYETYREKVLYSLGYDNQVYLEFENILLGQGAAMVTFDLLFFLRHQKSYEFSLELIQISFCL